MARLLIEDYEPDLTSQGFGAGFAVGGVVTVPEQVVDFSSYVYSHDEYHYHNAATCPDCGQGMVRQGRCFYCPECGFSSCGT